jgi:hypothetical protein
MTWISSTKQWGPSHVLGNMGCQHALGRMATHGAYVVYLQSKKAGGLSSLEQLHKKAKPKHYLPS